MSREMLLYLAGLTLRSFGVAALAGLVTFRIRSVAARHSVWVAALLTCLLMPIADAVLPAAFVPEPVQQLPVLTIFENVPALAAPAVSVSTDPSSSLESQWWFWAVMLYLSVFLVLLFRLGMAYRKVLNLRRTSRAVTVPEIRTVAAAHRLALVPDIRESAALCVPLTVGFADPAVIIPADWKAWDDWKLVAVLSHELAHIRRADWATTVIASLNRCVFWFNPFSWWIERHLSILSEKASDEASLAITGDAVRYAEVLLQFAAAAQTGQRLQVGGVAMARKNMRSRIERVLTISRPGTGILTRTGWLLVLALSLPVLYAASALHVTPESLPETLMAPILSMPLPPPVIEGVKSPEVKIAALAPRPVTVQAQPPLMQLRVVRQVKPIYPPLARQARIQGVVMLSVLVGEDGKVIEARVVAGHPVLQQAAIDSVSQWEFETPFVDGRPGRAVTTQNINFSFQEAGLAERSPAENAGGLASEPFPPPAPGVQRVRVARLRALEQVKPIYPTDAREQRIQGVVILEILVGLDGRPSQVRIVNGHPMFQKPAIDSVSQWRFEAQMLNGQPVEVVTTITLNFSLMDGNANAPDARTGSAPPAALASAQKPGTILVKNQGTMLMTQDGGTYAMTGAAVDVLSDLQRCQGCAIKFHDNGGIVSTKGAGMSLLDVRLAADGKEFELTTSSRECSITSVLPNGSTFVTSLAPGQSTRVPVSAQISVTFNR